MLVRLFSAQKDRDHYLLAVLAFVMVLAAAVLTVDSTFLVALAGFVLVGVATFILMEMAHSAERTPVLARELSVHHAYRKLSFTIAGIAPVLLVLIFVGGGLIFFLLPRVSAGYLNAYTGANDLTSGFSDRVELGRIGQIQQSKTVVMHVQVDGDTAGAFSLKLRGVALNNFDGREWSNNRDDKINVTVAARTVASTCWSRNPQPAKGRRSTTASPWSRSSARYFSCWRGRNRLRATTARFRSTPPKTFLMWTPNIRSRVTKRIRTSAGPIPRCCTRVPASFPRRCPIE